VVLLTADIESRYRKISASLREIPRIQLAFLPTPLQKLENLSELYGVELYLKRDDLTGAEFGGNKTRKYEFVMAEALEQGADCIVTGAAVQSNWCRQTVAASIRCGLQKTVLYLFGDRPKQSQGNLLLDEIMGAEIHLFELEGDENLDDALRRTERHRESRIAELENQGLRCQFIAPGAPFPTGHLGYVNAVVELAEDLQRRDMNLNDVDYMATAVGTGGTYTGLLAGARLLRSEAEVCGFCVSKSTDLAEKEAKILRGAADTAELLGATCAFDESDVQITEDYVGQSYGVPTDESTAALLQLAREEAVVLDPVYTAKAMAGLLDYIEKGIIPQGSRVVFWHTGGLPALFASRDTITEISRRVVRAESTDYPQERG
jgi:D-cysteine desulfhydrase family pyridoxal phosphate-dependent enzyme